MQKQANKNKMMDMKLKINKWNEEHRLQTQAKSLKYLQLKRWKKALTCNMMPNHKWFSPDGALFSHQEKIALHQAVGLCHFLHRLMKHELIAEIYFHNSIKLDILLNWRYFQSCYRDGRITWSRSMFFASCQWDFKALTNEFQALHLSIFFFPSQSVA